MVIPRPLTITARSGLKLHASEWSRRNAPVCLLLHGFAHDGRAWDPLAQALNERYRIIALDFRGHGDSSWDSSRSYCHQALQEDLNALIKQLQLSTFHLAGHSMGARVAMLHTAANPEQVRSLTIIDTGPIVGVKGADRIKADAEQQPRHFATREDYFQWLRGRLPLASRESLRQRAIHGLKPVDDGWQPKTDPEFAHILWQQDNNISTSNPAAATPSVDGIRQAPTPALTQELWDALEHITCPTLVVRGQLSSILHQDTAHDMAEQRLSAGRLVTIPMAGHSVMLDKPHECSEAVSEFIDSVETAQHHRQATTGKRLLKARSTAQAVVGGARR